MSYPQETLSTEVLCKQLKATGDFLHLTRSHEESMPAFCFEVQCKEKSEKSKVSVLDTGIIIFEPISVKNTARKAGGVAKDIVLSSAVHGNETAPIEICNTLIKKLILGELSLAHRVLFLFGNPASINIGKRFVEENLNRLFSGGHSKDQGQGAGLINKERYRALLLEETVRDFFVAGTEQANLLGIKKVERFHYDLHTAIRGSKNDKFSVYPYRHNQPWIKSQLQFMLACGVNTILFSNSPTTTFSYFSSNEFNAHAFTVELGKVRPFGENNMENFVQVESSLTGLVSGDDIVLKDYSASDFSFFEIDQIIDRHHEQFTLHFDDNVENFTDFPVGTVIATDGENQIKTHKEGEAIIFPNANVAIGQRAMLTVIPVNIDAQ
jgi:succinylglutamate desuccinylase